MGKCIDIRQGTATVLDLPQLTSFERSVRRIEMLLISSPEGFFRSHLRTYSCTNDAELDVILNHLKAEEFHGFWVHPHYSKNMRYGHALFTVNQHEVEHSYCKIDVMPFLRIDPDMPLYQLMRRLHLKNPETLEECLVFITQNGATLEDRHLASCYLFRHFAISIKIII